MFFEISCAENHIKFLYELRKVQEHPNLSDAMQNIILMAVTLDEMTKSCTPIQENEKDK